MILDQAGCEEASQFVQPCVQPYPLFFFLSDHKMLRCGSIFCTSQWVDGWYFQILTLNAAEQPLGAIMETWPKMTYSTLPVNFHEIQTCISNRYTSLYFMKDIIYSLYISFQKHLKEQFLSLVTFEIFDHRDESVLMRS